MLYAPRPLRPGLDGRDGGSAGEALFMIDVAAGAILDANATGWRMWGLDPAAVIPPVAIDRAMPSLSRLMHLAEVRLEAPLTFWTARGVLQLQCRAERVGTAACLVRAHGSQVALQTAARAAAPACPGAATAPDAMANARLAHELRTPLSAAIAYAEVLKDERFGPMANPRYRDYARNIYDSARHALGVVEGMLGGDPSRAGVPELAFADLDVNVVVESCLAVARPLAEAAGLRLTAEFGPRLPRVIADEVSLKQMLLNLLTNAIKFGRSGDRITVRVACELDGPLCVAVADTGPGIDPAAATAGRRRNAGLGIGLPLTRALAEANGAALTIDSAPGRGTQVTISFGRDRLVPV